MPTDDTSGKTRGEPTLPRVAAIATGLAATAYEAQAWMTDSPYWDELSRRPVVAALWMAASAVDWAEGGKFVVVAGTSLAVTIDSGRRLFAGRPPFRPARRRSAHAPRAFGLEATR